jgi:hypothetical protein
MILPQDSIESTRQLALRRYRETCVWLRRIRWCFAEGDRLQIVVGFPSMIQPGNRQILKGWIPANRLPDIRPSFDPFNSEAVGGAIIDMEVWYRGVFESHPESGEQT